MADSVGAGVAVSFGAAGDASVAGASAGLAVTVSTTVGTEDVVAVGVASSSAAAGMPTTAAAAAAQIMAVAMIRRVTFSCVSAPWLPRLNRAR